MTIDQAIAQCLDGLGLPDFEVTGGPMGLYLATDGLEDRIGSDPIIDRLRAGAEDCINYLDQIEQSKKRMDYASPMCFRLHQDHFDIGSQETERNYWFEFFDEETRPTYNSDRSFVFAVNGQGDQRVRRTPSRLSSGHSARGGDDLVPMFCDVSGINTDNPSRTAGVAFVSQSDRPSLRLRLRYEEIVSPPREMQQTVIKLAWLYACHPGDECEHRIREAVGEGAVFVEIKDKEGPGHIWKLHAKIRGLLTKTSNPNVRWWKRSAF